jgi:hypothetical protein
MAPTPEWLHQLPHKARKLEGRLYRTAPSLEYYLNRATLKTRLKKLARVIVRQFTGPAMSQQQRGRGENARNFLLPPSIFGGGLGLSSSSGGFNSGTPLLSRASLDSMRGIADSSESDRRDLQRNLSHGDSRGHSNKGDNNHNIYNSEDERKSGNAYSGNLVKDGYNATDSNNDSALRRTSQVSSSAARDNNGSQRPSFPDIPTDSNPAPGTHNMGAGVPGITSSNESMSELERQKAINAKLQEQIMENIRRQEDLVRRLQAGEQASAAAAATSYTSSPPSRSNSMSLQPSLQRNSSTTTTTRLNNSGQNNPQLQLQPQMLAGNNGNDNHNLNFSASASMLPGNHPMASMQASNMNLYMNSNNGNMSGANLPHNNATLHGMNQHHRQPSAAMMMAAQAAMMGGGGGGGGVNATGMNPATAAAYAMQQQFLSGSSLRMSPNMMGPAPGGISAASQSMLAALRTQQQMQHQQQQQQALGGGMTATPQQQQQFQAMFAHNPGMMASMMQRNTSTGSGVGSGGLGSLGPNLHPQQLQHLPNLGDGSMPLQQPGNQLGGNDNDQLLPGSFHW